MKSDNGQLTRRAALGVIAGTVGAVAVAGCERPGRRLAGRTQELTTDPTGHRDPGDWWHPDGYVVHHTVDTSNLEDGRIRAFVSGSWQVFEVLDLPDRFVHWSFRERLVRLQRLAQSGFQRRDLAGPHNACVATVGGPTRDSAVSLNTAYKGLGFAPKADRLAETIELLARKGREAEASAGGIQAHALLAKTRVLADLYLEPSRFDRTKQVSLELFATPDHPTHTFLNMMANPVASASFLDFPTFEIRAIPRFLHPKNPDLTEHERLLAQWTNAVHDFVHGGPGDRMACVYHVFEVFDDSPHDEAKGRRIA